MAKPFNADWNLAQALYVAGTPYPEIAKRVGVTEVSLRKRVSRHGWFRLKTEACAVASPPADKPLRSLLEHSQKVRQLIAQDVAESSELLPQLKQTTNAVGFRQRQAAVGALAEVAARTFSWGQDDQRPSVRINVLNLATLCLPSPPHDAAISSAQIEAEVLPPATTPEPPVDPAA